MCALRICSAIQVPPERWRALAPSPAQLDDPAIEPRCSVHCGLSRKCNGSRGKLMRTCEQKVNKEEKLTLTFHPGNDFECIPSRVRAHQQCPVVEEAALRTAGGFPKPS
jgi:hypothetical protein